MIYSIREYVLPCRKHNHSDRDYVIFFLPLHSERPFNIFTLKGPSCRKQGRAFNMKEGVSA